MQQTQIITYGIEGILAERLRELAQARRCWLRETMQIPACRALVQAAPPSVLVLRLGRDLEQELALLECVHRTCPQTALIAIGAADNPALAGLAWDSGATFALFPPTPVEAAADLILRILSDESP